MFRCFGAKRLSVCRSSVTLSISTGELAGKLTRCGYTPIKSVNYVSRSFAEGRGHAAAGSADMDHAC
jgi:hypothetical protein